MSQQYDNIETDVMQFEIVFITFIISNKIRFSNIILIVVN